MDDDELYRAPLAEFTATRDVPRSRSASAETDALRQEPPAG